jgi:hypothetical protein
VTEPQTITLTTESVDNVEGAQQTRLHRTSMAAAHHVLESHVATVVR